MGIKEQQDELFAELKNINPNIIPDGGVDEEEYLKAAYKILYVLKEVNGGKNWSLVDFLREGGRPQSWNNISCWTEAILNLPIYCFLTLQLGCLINFFISHYWML